MHWEEGSACFGGKFVKYGKNVNLSAKSAPFFSELVENYKFFQIEKIASEEKIFSKYKKLPKN